MSDASASMSVQGGRRQALAADVEGQRPCRTADIFVDANAPQTEPIAREAPLETAAYGHGRSIPGGLRGAGHVAVAIAVGIREHRHAIDRSRLKGVERLAE